jgi:hypothetical protein
MAPAHRGRFRQRLRGQHGPSGSPVTSGVGGDDGRLDHRLARSARAHRPPGRHGLDWRRRRRLGQSWRGPLRLARSWTLDEAIFHTTGSLGTKALADERMAASSPRGRSPPRRPHAPPPFSGRSRARRATSAVTSSPLASRARPSATHAATTRVVPRPRAARRDSSSAHPQDRQADRTGGGRVSAAADGLVDSLVHQNASPGPPRAGLNVPRQLGPVEADSSRSAAPPGDGQVPFRCHQRHPDSDHANRRGVAC